MEANNPNPNINPIEAPVQTQPTTPTSPAHNKQRIIIAIFGAIFLIATLGITAYYLGTLNKEDIDSENTQTLPSPTDINTQSSPTQDISKNSIIIYEHPTAHYTLEYPSSWKYANQPIHEGIQQDHADFAVQSPDYQLSSEGIESLTKGSEIWVRVENSTEKSIDGLFNKDTLASSIAKNITKTTVDGMEAIQYDYSYENSTATMTIFLKNNKYYTVKYRYVDSVDKQTEWNTYINLLKSIKTK